ncbi:MAG TPA: YraN family protein [Acidimicrobiales bacterium]|nr:YraN family protein [Acidimicrobiales bacterium]
MADLASAPEIQHAVATRESARTLGARGEDIATRWYEANGYSVVARNWRRNEGEIDLIVRKGRLYVFCEVKARSSDRFGTPAEAVTASKRSKIRHLAARWLAEDSPGPAREIRFDVAAIMMGKVGHGDPGGLDVTVEVIEGAF